MNRMKLVSAFAALAIVALTIWLVIQFWPTHHVESTRKPTDESTEASATRTLVRLTDAKAKAADIKTQTATRKSLAITRTLPARFAYDDTRHVAVRAAADGVLETVLVKPGDVVVEGQPLAVLRSPSVGAARGQVLSQTAAVEIAKTEQTWKSEIHRGVQRLAERILQHAPIESIEKEFNEATLGAYRSQLLTSYSKAILASKLSRSANSIEGSGAISGRVVQQRQSQQEQVESELQAAIEQSLFETDQARKQAVANLETADRNLLVARQALANLIGLTIDAELLPEVPLKYADLSRLEIRSPLAGTVERRSISATERVTEDAELFIIADPSRLWVEADVRERDWDALQLKEGDAVAITTPAAANERLPATVYFVGREVDPASGAVPLVAQMDNPEGKYRPGLFARVEVKIGETPRRVVVPESAVVDLDGQASVFVAEQGGYRPVAIEIGVHTADQIEVLSGIDAGQAVVVHGAFSLKSELLLEGEE